MAEGKTQPGEGHVAHQFAFCLGVVAGVNSMHAARGGKHVGDEELPHGYSFAGTALDTLAGDALLETDGVWYLLEMKRGYAELQDELVKTRVKNLQQKLKKLGNEWTQKRLLSVARQGHQFLYACRQSGSAVPELATLSYLDWLVDKKKDASEWKAKSLRFVDLLLQPPKLKGFTFEQLAKYVTFMNEEGKTSLGDTEETGNFLGLVVDAAGSATLLAQSQLEQRLAVELGRRARVEATDKRQPVSRPAPRGTGRRGG
jgi:hypothetical protein